MGIMQTAKEVEKYDKEAEKKTGYKISRQSPDDVVMYFDAYVDARRSGMSQKKADILASKASKLKKVS